MKNKLSLAIACGIATMGLASTSFAEKSFNIGGDFEYDITGTSASKDPNDPNDLYTIDKSSFNHTGRAKLNAVGMVKNDAGYFAKGVAQPLLKVDTGDLGTDDIYFQFGKTDSWNLQMGRFEGIDLVPVGKDTVAEKTGQVSGYRGNDFRGRRSDHLALNIGGKTGFGAQIGLVYDKNGTAKTSVIRPVVTYDTGSMKFHAGIESGTDMGTDVEGFGVGLKANLGAGAVGLAYASNDADDSTINLNYTQGSWGVAYNRNEDDANNTTEDTLYAAYTMPLLGLKGASVTFAASTSSADGLATGVEDSVNALRTRFNYTF